MPFMHNKPLTRTQHRALGTWVFGSLFFLFFVGVFVFAPETLPEFKQRMLAIASALLAGLFGYFLTGEMGLEIQSIKSRFGEMGVKATGGIAVFVLVLVWWLSPLAPVGSETAPPPAKVIQIGSGTVNIYEASGERLEKLAGELGVTKAALTSFFKILEQKQVPLGDLDSTLRTIATRYKELDQKLATFTSEDPEVTALKRAAPTALEAGDFARTEALLTEA